MTEHLTAPFERLERLTLNAPLGVRFWDTALGTYVRGRLRVSVYPEGDPLRATEAVANRSGTYVLHHAAGLGDFEMGLLGTEFTETIPARSPFIVEVRDFEGRFLPVAFEAELPFKGLFRRSFAASASPLEPPDDFSIPLYSSISRSAPSGLAFLRAELYETAAAESDEGALMKPAAWAVLEAYATGAGAGLLGRGIADEEGRVMLVFAYPPPRSSGSSSAGSAPGPFTAGLPFLDQQWPIELRAYYDGQGDVLSPPSPASPLASTGARGRGLPYLSRLLDQSPAALFLDQAQTEPLTQVTLMYGPRVYAPPAGSAADSPLNEIPLSILFITPAGSPPS